jgi:hypothetical protein
MLEKMVEEVQEELMLVVMVESYRKKLGHNEPINES